MADFTKARETRTQGEIIDRVFVMGEEAEFIFGRGTQIFPCLPVPIYGSTQVRLVADDVAEWMEFGFKIDAQLSGNAAAGFADAGNYLKLELEQSLDLVTWNMGKFEPAPTPEVNNGDGTYTYWSRCTLPRVWKFVRVDLTLTSNRAGKSISNLKLFGTTIALTGYPYAMPADASRLQTDLLALGYTGATVSSVSNPLTVEVWSHDLDVVPFAVTMVGSDVTDVKNSSGTTIALAYPYAMPAQAATLKAALVAAGYTYANVRCYADEWTIFIPNRDTVFNNRQLTATITPADSFTYVGAMGTGTDPGNIIDGTSGNVRATTGLTPRTEAGRQFARLKLSAGSRYDPWK